MDNDALIQNFKGLCNEVCKISPEEKEKIFKLLDRIPEISTISDTEDGLIDLCKQVDVLLYKYDLLQNFMSILKNNYKFVHYKLIVSDGQLFKYNYLE